jgi:hypothetical protein
MTKRGPKREGKRYPYEACVIGGKLIMPAELQRIHRLLLDTAMIEVISDETRAAVERHWPELVHKLPPKKPHG